MTGNLYEGPASLVVGDRRHAVRVRLAGHLNTFDGRYHWQGTLHGAPADVTPGGKQVRVCVGDRDALAQLVEHVPGGGLMVSGTGTPPFWP